MSTISCLNCGGLTRHVSGCKGDPEVVTVPRDQYELYKEAAEAWAEEQTPERKGGRAKCLVCLRTMYFGSSNGMRCEVNHTSDCKAARILGLKREA